MDSSWTRVRQLVANRVLHRHLQDLEEQQVAAEMTHRQHVRQEMECERRARRNRASSVQMGSPVVPPAAANRTPRRSQATPRPHIAKDGGSQVRREETGGTTLVDVISSTLETARMTEQRSSSLYLQTPASATKTSGRPSHLAAAKGPTLVQPSNTKQPSSSPPPPPPLVDQRPRFEREETFIKTDKSQVFFLDGSSSSTVLTDDSDTDSNTRPKGNKTSALSAPVAKEQRKASDAVSNSKTIHKRDPDPDADFGAPPSRPGGKVNVDFCGDDTRLEKNDGGFNPHCLALPLDILSDEVVDKDDAEDEEKMEEEGMGESDDGAALAERADPSGQARKYTRDCDPLHRRMPRDSV